MESAVEHGLELSTFVDCGGSDLGRRRDSYESRSRRRSEEGIPLVVILAARSRQKGVPSVGGKRKSRPDSVSSLPESPPSGSPTANSLPCCGRATFRVGAEQLFVAYKEKLCHMRTRNRLCLEPQVLSQLHSGVNSRCSGPSDVCHSPDPPSLPLSPSHSYFLYISLPEDREKPRAFCEKVGRAFPHGRQLEQYSARWGEGLAHLPPSLPFPVPDGTLS